MYLQVADLVDDANTPLNYTLGFSLNKVNKPHQFHESNNIFNEIYLETVALVEDIYSAEGSTL